MGTNRVNYDEIARTYDQRYTVNQFAGIAAGLLSLAQRCRARRILEVGCGTGRWLAALFPCVAQVYGVDLSLGMLRQAQQKQQFHLICGQAGSLPFSSAVFDLVFCVNAFHHFDDPHRFIAEARRLLRQGGALAIIGMDPHGGHDRWYLYDFFTGTYDTDLRRFPSKEVLSQWLVAAGFHTVDWCIAERIVHTIVGRAVFDDPILQKQGTSQLALLTDEAYALGMRRIEAAVAEAEAAGKTRIFPVDISLTMLTGWV